MRVRFASTVHGEADNGFVAMTVAADREHDVAGYPGDGTNRLPAVHRSVANQLEVPTASLDEAEVDEQFGFLGSILARDNDSTQPVPSPAVRAPPPASPWARCASCRPRPRATASPSQVGRGHCLPLPRRRDPTSALQPGSRWLLQGTADQGTVTRDPDGEQTAEASSSAWWTEAAVASVEMARPDSAAPAAATTRRPTDQSADTPRSARYVLAVARPRSGENRRNAIRDLMRCALPGSAGRGRRVRAVAGAGVARWSRWRRLVRRSARDCHRDEHPSCVPVARR